MSVSTEVLRCGDTELWIIAHENWELPILAEPYGADGKHTHYRLRPPMDATVTVPMLKALDIRIKHFQVPAASSYVMVKYEDLHKLGRKAPGITPGYYVRWPGQEPAAGGVDPERLLPAPPEPDAGQDFCAYLYRLTAVVDYPTLRLVWKAIIQYGPKWLMEEKKPIHLGFCKLVPIPYRANWKSLLTARFPAAWRPEVFHSQDFTEELRNTVLAAMNTKNLYCYYGLEAVTNEDWRAYANMVEGKRVAQLGGGRYAEYWRKCIKKLCPHLMEAFQEWARAVRVPCGQLDQGLLLGSRRIIPWVPRGRVTPAAPVVPGGGRVVVDDPNPPLKGPGPTKPLYEKGGHLSELSDIRPEPRHVRLPALAGPVYDVQESKDEPDGTHGVLLPDVPESAPAGGDVLDEGPGPGVGVAGPP